MLEHCARLSLERAEFAERVAHLEAELAKLRRDPKGTPAGRGPAGSPPAPGARSSASRVLRWIAMALSALITAAVVVAALAILAGFWSPADGGTDPADAGGTPAPRAAPAAPAAAGAPPETSGASGSTASVTISAGQGRSWLEVRRGSADGRQLHYAMLESGQSRSFTAPRLWLRFGIGENIAITVDGEPVEDLPALAAKAVVTPDGFRILGLG